MRISRLLVSVCLLPLVAIAADGPAKPSATMGSAPSTRAAAVAPGVAGVTQDQAMVALLGLIPLIQEFDLTVKPLGMHYQPFSIWAGQTRQELQVLVDAAKMGKTNGEILVLSNKAKAQFDKAIKIAKAVVGLDADVYYLNNQIAIASDCLAKRQASLQQADSKAKQAIQLAMTGVPTTVTSLKSLVTDANAACP